MQNQTPYYFSDSKGNFYLPFETDLVTGYLPVEIPKIKDPVLRWRGPKINLENEWYPATSFMFDFQKHEVVLRLFVTADKSQIVIRPMTQIYGTGMSVKEEPTKEDREEIIALGLTDVGSVHSHCKMKAFQSGTDADDERNWPGGLHLTVGRLDEKQYDLHARFAWDIPGLEEEGKVVRKAQRLLQTPYFQDWFILPEHVARFLAEEEALAAEITRYILCKPVDAAYPDWWKQKLIEHSFRGFQGMPAGSGILTSEMFPQEVFYKKKKGKKGNGIEDLERRKWACWQICMQILADVPQARELHWSVSDFKPQNRERLIGYFPVAKEIWEHIQEEMKKLELTDADMFEGWDWDSKTQ